MGFPPGPPPFDVFCSPMPPPPFGMGCATFGGHQLPMAGIDLSDEQVDKMAALNRQHSDKVEPAMLKLHSLERDFHAALAHPDDGDLKKLSNQIAAQHQVLEQLNCDHMIETAQILTPEQRRKMQLQMERAELGPMGFKKQGGPPGAPSKPE